MHKCAQLRQRLSTARHYEWKIQNGVNTSTVILLKTKFLVRLTFRQLFLLGGEGITDLNRVPGDFAASLTTESHFRLRCLKTYKFDS